MDSQPHRPEGTRAWVEPNGGRATMEISCAFAPSIATPDHIALAEELGYRRAWCYDSPALYPDVWMTLARAAERTHRIVLGLGVLVPGLRHVMTNAAAIATLVALAPGRVGVGAGFTGRLALGQPPQRWQDVRAYLRALKALLRGEEVDWEGAAIRMLQPAGFAPARPIEVPFLVAAQGPKGLDVARELGDGIFTVGPQGGFPWVAEPLFGTVLDLGEEAGSERALAAGQAAAVFYHAAYLGKDATAVDRLPAGAVWRRRAERVPERARHLAIHAGHLVGLGELDRGIVMGQRDSKAGFVSDEEVPATTMALAPGTELHRLWGADKVPTFPQAGSPTDQRTFFPPLGGYRFLLFTVPPVEVSAPPSLGVSAATREAEEKLPGLLPFFEADGGGCTSPPRATSGSCSPARSRSSSMSGPKWSSASAKSSARTGEGTGGSIDARTRSFLRGSSWAPTAAA